MDNSFREAIVRGKIIDGEIYKKIDKPQKILTQYGIAYLTGGMTATITFLALTSSTENFSSFSVNRIAIGLIFIVVIHLIIFYFSEKISKKIEQ